MGFGERLQSWWRRVRGYSDRITEGLTLQQLWAQFRREARVSYRLYSAELEAGGRARPPRLRLARALFWAMLRKLSPPRRVFLLVALVLALYGLAGDRTLWSALGGAGLLVLLALELADRVAMKRDLEIAREIQSWLVPRTPPAVAGVEVAFATRPANTVAGDYYDAYLRPHGATGPRERLLLVVADVAGKGMPAALLMATFQSSLWTLAEAGMPLGEVVAGLNRYCCEHSLEGRRFTTALLAELDPATGELIYVNAGHNPPALRRADGRLERLETGGLPLGVSAAAGYGLGALTLAAGDLLVIFTDGVVEARNAAGEEYGDERLVALLTGETPASAAAALERLLAAVEAFTGDSPRQDDVTCLVLRVAGR